MQKYQAPSVKRAFHILKLISDAERGLTLSELAKSLGVSKSSVLGITAAMEEIGAIIRNPFDRRYTIGYTLIELGKKGLARFPLKEISRRHIEGLVEQTGETVFLGICKDYQILILDVVESRKELKITSPIGTKIPLTAGAAGKIFLAFMDEKTALKLITTKALKRFTKNTITDSEKYLQEIRKVRAKGFATDHEEYLQGVNAVAALIKNNSSVLTAIWVVGFSSFLTEVKMHRVIEKTLVAANAISEEMKRGEKAHE